MSKKARQWVFVTYRRPYTACYKRTRLGAIWHSWFGHFDSGRVMLRSEWVKSLPRNYRWMEMP